MVYAPIAISSPCAIFITPIRPNTMDNPIAINIRMVKMLRPVKACKANNSKSIIISSSVTQFVKTSTPKREGRTALNGPLCHPKVLLWLAHSFTESVTNNYPPPGIVKRRQQQGRARAKRPFLSLTGRFQVSVNTNATSSVGY